MLRQVFTTKDLAVVNSRLYIDTQTCQSCHSLSRAGRLMILMISHDGMSFESFLPTGLSLPKRKSAPGMSYAGTDAACGFCSTLMNSCSEMRLSPSSSASPGKFGWCLASWSSGVGVSHAANIKKRSPMGNAMGAVKSFPKLTFLHAVRWCPKHSFVDELPQGFLGKIHLQLLALNGRDGVDGFN